MVRRLWDVVDVDVYVHVDYMVPSSPWSVEDVRNDIYLYRGMTLKKKVMAKKNPVIYPPHKNSLQAASTSLAAPDVVNHGM